MVIFHIKHYLNRMGINYFKEWFNDLSMALDKFDEFISTKYSFDEQDFCVVNLFLEFSSIASLEIWRNSSEHKRIKSLLDNYKIKEHSSFIYKVNNHFDKSKSTFSGIQGSIL